MSRRNGYAGVYRKASDGTGDEELLYKHTPGANLRLTDWSADGRFLCLWSGDVLFSVPLNTDSRSLDFDSDALDLVRGSFSTWGGALSPDNRFYAYGSDESGKPEVYIQAFDPTSGRSSSDIPRSQVSEEDGDGVFFWAKDGREIYYFSNKQHAIMSVDISSYVPLTVSAPKIVARIQSNIQSGEFADISRSLDLIVIAT